MFRPIFTSPTGTPRATRYSLSSPTRIIIHHTAGHRVNTSYPYHFQIDTDGTIHYVIRTDTQSGATMHNNNNSIQIAVIGNFHENDNMATRAQISSLQWLIVDLLWSFSSIPRINRFNLNETNMRHFGLGSRMDLPVQFRRHTNTGILGHTDALREATDCPGINFYRRLRDDIIDDAIFLANHIALSLKNIDDLLIQKS